MAFGQPSGPPATARQVRDLTALVEAAGHSGFRDARGALGLTQRQAGGRFTRNEAEALIARLEAESEAGAPVAGAPGAGAGDRPARATPVAPRRTPPGARAATLVEQLQRVPEELLVDELRRRGWALIPPSPPT